MGPLLLSASCFACCRELPKKTKRLTAVSPGPAKNNPSRLEAQAFDPWRQAERDKHHDPRLKVLQHGDEAIVVAGGVERLLIEDPPDRIGENDATTMSSVSSR